MNNRSIFKFAAMTALAAISFSCKEKKTVDLPEFPYESYVQTVENGDGVLDGYGDGLQPISDKAVYLELPADLADNSFVDSLAVIYNANRALGAMVYDLTTASRNSQDSALAATCGIAMMNIAPAGISDTAVCAAVIAVGKSVGADVARNVDTYQVQYPESYRLNDMIESYYRPLTVGRQEQAWPQAGDAIADYAEVHRRAVSDTTDYGDTLLEKALTGSSFEARAAYAHEYGLWAMRNRGDARTMVAVIDPILRSDRYAPELADLWLMWRTALQLNLLGGRSNDSRMYNLFYNEMCDRVALCYLRHLVENRADDGAFNAYIYLAMNRGVVRQSSCIFGNNANLDEMNLVNAN